MAAKSTTTRYGWVAITIHWLSALLIIILWGSGMRAAGFTESAAKAEVLAVHVPLGIAILVLTLVRIGWWWWADDRPGPTEGTPRWQDFAGRAVHLLFYVVILLMTASGIALLAFSGAGPVIFGGAEGTLPDFWQFPPRGGHAVGARLMLALFVLHVAAALYHQFVRRDGLIGRMWFARGS